MQVLMVKKIIPLRGVSGLLSGSVRNNGEGNTVGNSEGDGGVCGGRVGEAGGNDSDVRR